MKKIICLCIVLVLVGCKKEENISSNPDQQITEGEKVSYSDAKPIFQFSLNLNEIDEMLFEETQKGVTIADYSSGFAISTIIPINDGYLAVSTGVYADYDEDKFDFFVLLLDETGAIIRYDHYDNCIFWMSEGVESFASSKYIYIIGTVGFENSFIIYDYDGNVVENVDLNNVVADYVVYPMNIVEINGDLFIWYNASILCCEPTVTHRTFQGSLVKFNSEGKFLWNARIRGGLKDEELFYVYGIHGSATALYIYGVHVIESSLDQHFEEMEEEPKEIMVKYDLNGKMQSKYIYESPVGYLIKNWDKTDYLYKGSEKNLFIINLEDGGYETIELDFYPGGQSSFVYNDMLYAFNGEYIYQYDLNTGETQRYIGVNSYYPPQYFLKDGKVYFIDSSKRPFIEIYELPN